MLAHLTDDLGVVLRRDLVRAGLDDNAIARRCRAGELIRLRQGVYAATAAYTAADVSGRHLMLCRGVMRLYPADVALSHTSAAVAYGAPAWQVPLDLAHVTGLEPQGTRTQARVRHHEGVCRVGDISRRDGHWITAPARTALDAASLLDRDAAVCVLDWFVESGHTTLAECRQQLLSRREWDDHLDLTMKLDHAREGSQSVAESRCHLLFSDHGLPSPLQQVEVRDERGWLVGVVDFAWPEHRLVLEFDGTEKYHRYRKPGESIEEMVLREKRREDRIRELTGWTVIRISWADLEHPARLVERLRRQLARSA
ncbi:type IV toxin-antitoxin system AbiEi family antitoxin domain-containing protein [uncultured Nocardioides sp.]|jgi:very-short-patch-repair endonuclease|uniref:type IV toxin-antitoxin system AbiEi family antitoxin domain-containing protein n=1 Tax=uncultured Nocardioides sp. TaxID=198441 RepID=UPI0030FC21B2